MLDINSTMAKLASALEYDLRDLCDLGEVSSQKRCVVLKNFNKMPFTSLLKLSDALDVDFDRLVQGQLDYQALYHHIHGDKGYVPLRYQVYQKSRMATMSNLLTCARKVLPEFQITRIKRKLQLTDEALRDPAREVSVLLLMDLFQEIGQLVKVEDFFKGVGRSHCRKHSQKVLSQLPNLKSPKKVFEAFIENSYANIELNMEYKVLKATAKWIILSANTRQETQDNFKLPRFANAYHYQNIEGHYGQMFNHIYEISPTITRLPSFRGTRAELIVELRT